MTSQRNVIGLGAALALLAAACGGGNLVDFDTEVTIGPAEVQPMKSNAATTPSEAPAPDVARAQHCSTARSI